MAKKRKPPMTKVVPVKMSDELYERLQNVSKEVGEPDSTIIRLVLRAGLAQIERDHFTIFKFEAENFASASETEKDGAGVGGRSSDSTSSRSPTPEPAKKAKP